VCDLHSIDTYPTGQRPAIKVVDLFLFLPVFTCNKFPRTEHNKSNFCVYSK
jgi:hypothetical protein